MSGLEVAGLVFGVLPIVVEIVQSYQRTCNALRTFRKAATIVQKFEKLLLVQKSSFLTNISLLLRLLHIQEATVTSMLQDPTHTLWRDELCNDLLRNLLGDNYEACEVVVLCIRELLRDIEHDLHRLRNGSTEAVLRAVSLVFKEAKIDEKLKGLRRLNSDLTSLRRQLSELQQQPFLEDSALGNRGHPGFRPQHMANVQTASIALYEALESAWCRTDGVQVQHSAKLCIEATTRREIVPEESVCLDLALSHKQICSSSVMGPSAEPLMWLYVQCTASRLDSNPRNPVGSDSASAASRMSGVERLTVILKPPSCQTQARAPPPKRHRSMNERSGLDPNKRLRPDLTTESATPSLPVSLAVTNPSILSAEAVSERGGKLNLCRLLNQNRQRICHGGPSRAEHCLYCLESSNRYTHTFYSGATRETDHSPSQQTTDKLVISLEELVQRSTERTLPIIDQLKIALRLAIAVLQFHSTPWLQEEWGLQDVSFLGICDEPFDEQGALSTLHLSVLSREETGLHTLPTPTTTTTTTATTTNNQSTLLNKEQLHHLCGIRNITMASLGRALMQIGYREPLHAQSKPYEPHDIITARRLAEGRPTPLGPRFQRLARKCFRYDDDLTKADVRNAVYEDVVCELEGLVKVLSIDP